MARAASCVALSYMMPVIMATNTDMVYLVVDSLQQGLPGQPDCEHSPVLQFYHGLGLGFILARLFEEQFVDISGSQGMVAVWKAVNALEAASFGMADNRYSSSL